MITEGSTTGARVAKPIVLLKTLRPKQWVKNLFVLAPMVFAQALLDRGTELRSLIAFGVFCCLASAVYVINDVSDVEGDRAHPVKRNRPIASGALSLPAARVLIAALLGVAAITSAIALPWLATVMAGAYLALNLAYTYKLKKVAYADVLCIALGFELRVLTGSFAAKVPPSAYLLVVTFLLSTFLGFGKRLHELSGTGDVSSQRSVLKRYDQGVVNRIVALTGLLTIATYVLYTLDPHTRAMFHTDYLVVTTVFTTFGFGRFYWLVRHRPNAESPTEEMLKDLPFIANLVLWAIAIVLLIYAPPIGS